MPKRPNQTEMRKTLDAFVMPRDEAPTPAAKPQPPGVDLDNELVDDMEASLDPPLMRSDLILFVRALRNDWPVSRRKLARTEAQCRRIVGEGKANQRMIARAIEALGEIEKFRCRKRAAKAVQVTQAAQENQEGGKIQ